MGLIRLIAAAALVPLLVWAQTTATQTPVTQTQATPKRPRVALVLEGGAALGFAHIGVLEWLEAKRVPVDVIVGASMGGLIGGFYAAGHSPAEIREIARSADWPMLLGGETAFRDLSYRRKEDRLAFPTRLELGIKNGLVLPAGFNEGHQIGLMLSRLTLGYPSLNSFDELPTPFRCVAADLVSGKLKVWDSGPLNEALRSTMSIPGVFSPVRKDKGIYVDGGLLDNLPVDVAKKLGVDLIIAVHLSKGPVDPKQLGSLSAVLGQSISVMIAAAEMRTIQLADVVLVADLAAFGTSDYGRNQEIIAAGTAAAEAKARVLGRFALDEADYAEFQRKRASRTRQPLRRIESISVAGASTGSTEAVAQKLTEVVGKDPTVDSFESELTKTVGQGRYASLRYHRATADGDGVEVAVTPKESGPITVTPAVEINGVDSSNTRFSIGSRITWLDFWGYRGEWRNDVWFGSHFGASSEIYKPFTPNSRFFIAPRLYVDSNPFDVYSSTKRVAEYRLRRQGMALDAGVQLNRFSELRLGYQLNWLRASLRVGDPTFNSVAVRRDAVALRYSFEGQDDAIVGRRGVRVATRVEYYPNFGNNLGGYTLAEGGIQDLIPVSKQNSLILGLAGGGVLGPLRSGFLTFSLGGAQRLGAYGVNEILARNYTLGTFGVLHELKSQPSLFGSKVFLVGYAQAARARDFQNDTRYPANATGGVLLRTLFGPIFVGGSVGDSGHRKWFFGVGRFF